VQDAQKLAEGDCATDRTQVIGRWQLGITFDGLRACYLKDGAAWILWTYKSEWIAARAVRRDGASGSLFEWWDNEASRYLR